HAPSAAFVLLRRLKDEMHCAVEIGQSRAGTGRGERHGRVAVMPAGMHDTGHAGDMLCAALFADRQGVDIGPYADAAPAGAAAQGPDHPRPCKAAMHLQSKPIELGGDELRGLALVEGELRMTMQMMS